MNNKNIFKKITAFTLSFTILGLSVYSVFKIAPFITENIPDTALFATCAVFPGEVTSTPPDSNNNIQTIATVQPLESFSSVPNIENDNDAISILENEDTQSNPATQNNTNSQPANVNNSTDNNSDKTKLPIIEKQMTNAGVQYQNIFINKEADKNIDIARALSNQPDIHIRKNGKPQVLIVHTHTTEGYTQDDCGYYYEGDLTRSTNNNENITQVGNAIAEKLEAAGIGVIHDTTVHDYPSYNGSYSRAEKTIQSNLDKYPSIEVVIDVHRDAIISQDGKKYKPTTTINGKKAAQLLILSGCDQNLTFQNWESNFRFALRIQKQLADTQPNLVLPLKLTKNRYNMHLSKGSILLEVGSDGNTLEEAIYSGELFGDALVEVLEDLQN